MTKQKLGQNFLHDRRIAARIADTVLQTNNTILEIGPGKGIMTGILAESPGERRIVAIEKDEELYNILLSNEGLSGVELLNKDILKLNIGEISEERSITILSNIPYYISKEILNWIINGNKFITNGTLMVQKEFFLKITSSPGLKIYNAQSVIFGLLFDSNKLFEVKPGSFSPPPKVTSIVFSFKRSGPGPNDIPGLYSMLKTAFIHRRKTLINNLGKVYDKNTIKKFLETKSLPSDIRAEDMTREDLRELYYSLKNIQERPVIS
ncbi:MAG: ribosomal RNA small subunit methyltransferase A [Candidatus Aminicenantes bacterium]|nr:ribosomal RNA small subunit methyltransferase A [Candidatus Aminicenantes bacterium]